MKNSKKPSLNNLIEDSASQLLGKNLPNINPEQFKIPSITDFKQQLSTHKPKFVLLYGSLREVSYSRLVVEECARLLTAMGAEVKIFNPTGLPLPDTEDTTHPKVIELRDLVPVSYTHLRAHET